MKPTESFTYVCGVLATCGVAYYLPNQLLVFTICTCIVALLRGVAK